MKFLTPIHCICIQRFFSRTMCVVFLEILFLICFSLAELPPQLPGEEISEEYMRLIFPADSISKHEPPSSFGSKNWLDMAMATWIAPPLYQQMVEDKTRIPMGKGAVFVPRLSEMTQEPDVVIFDSNGKTAAEGKPGRHFALLPGNYTISFGSGSDQQQIKRKILVPEGKPTVLVPDWSGLIVDVVNEENNPFRGEYELARIDDFEAYGRGYGRDPDLGEALKTWILKPGRYKIFGVGASYNTLTNFITVRLLPGELLRVLLVQKESSGEIIGGGTIEFASGTPITSHWRYNLSVGGSIQFTSEQNKVQSDTIDFNSTIALLINSTLSFKKKPYEWDTRLRLIEGLAIQGTQIRGWESNDDEFRLSTLFLVRFLSWLGPYTRLEAETSLFPRYFRIGKEYESLPHYFITVGADSLVAAADIDTKSTSILMRHRMSPFVLEAGLGANADVMTTRWLEAKLRIGFGLTQTITKNTMDIIDSTEIKNWSSLQPDLRKGQYVFMFRKQPAVNTLEYGPEAALNGAGKIGRWATAETEIRFFAPLERITKPDFDWTWIIGWRLGPAVTLDYEYKYTLRRPEKIPNLALHRHRVLIRYNYTTR